MSETSAGSVSPSLQCKKCNEPLLSPDVRFCGVCGALQQEKKECVNVQCGKEIPGTFNFCPYCGTNQSPAIGLLCERGEVFHQQVPDDSFGPKVNTNDDKVYGIEGDLPSHTANTETDFLDKNVDKSDTLDSEVSPNTVVNNNTKSNSSDNTAMDHKAEIPTNTGTDEHMEHQKRNQKQQSNFQAVDESPVFKKHTENGIELKEESDTNSLLGRNQLHPQNDQEFDQSTNNDQGEVTKNTEEERGVSYPGNTSSSMPPLMNNIVEENVESDFVIVEPPKDYNDESNGQGLETPSSHIEEKLNDQGRNQNTTDQTLDQTPTSTSGNDMFSPPLVSGDYLFYVTLVNLISAAE